MTREEIEELKGLAASMGLYDDKNPCKRAVILGKAVEALEKEPAEWIPVSERLPEKGGEYLCCYGKHIHIGQMINGHFRHYGEIADHLIVAWMPLPDPYEESEG